jgi:hypothetical protein
MKTTHRPLIDTVAARYALDADLLEAQVIIESSGQADAFRWEEGFYQHYILGKTLPYGDLGPLAACSYGLLQIMFAVAYELGFRGRPEELFVPAVGLDLGAKKLRRLVDWAGGDVEQALCAYNGGQGLNHARPFTNQRYATKVFQEKERPA